MNTESTHTNTQVDWEQWAWIAAHCIRGGAVEQSSRGAMSPSNLSISRTHSKFVCWSRSARVAPWVYYHYYFVHHQYVMCLLLKSTVHWFFLVFHVEKWNRLIMHDSWAPVRRGEGVTVSVDARGCSESQSFSLGLMFALLFVRVYVHVCTCVWWKDWEQKPEAQRGAQLRTMNQLTQTLSHTFWMPIFRLFLSSSSVFVCYLLFCSLSFTSFSCFSSIHHLSPGVFGSSLLTILFFSPLTPLLSLPPYLSIFTHHSPSSLLSHPPSLCGWAPVIGC